MLNERKVRLMTKLAIYEKSEGRQSIGMTKYFQGDYVSWNVIKTIIWITVAYILGAGVWLIYNSEDILQNIASLNYFAIIRYAVLLYCILVIGYAVIAYFVYSARYRRAMKSVAGYEKGLKELARIHMEETRRLEELGGQKEI